ncbi:MAG TPA: helix-turn-helix domain-containing protein [Terriglobales bacterium]|nr:helix-turn-helix domain-containing protein [Terriglobales bacterium]
MLGATRTSVRATVEVAGYALRMESALFSQLLVDTQQLERILRRYAYAFLMQVSQGAACNRLHQTPERLARWLAMGQDRTGSELLPLTHERLAEILGCRRSSVTAAVGLLQQAGAIRCSRGQIRILNRNELERWACECYPILRRLTATSFPGGSTTSRYAG